MTENITVTLGLDRDVALAMVGNLLDDLGFGWAYYPYHKPTDDKPTDYLVRIFGGGLTVMLWLPEEQTFWYDPLDRYYSEDEIEKYRRILND